jgi:hypothetical protein
MKTTKKWIKKGLSVLLSAAMVLSGMQLIGIGAFAVSAAANEERIYISSVEITDIEAPAAGAVLDATAACATTGVSTNESGISVSYTEGGAAVTDETAGYLKTYTAAVELEADTADNYAFSADTTATVNGETATASYDASTGKLTVSYTFDKTEKKALANAYYVTPDDLMNCFDLDGTDDTVGEIYFGSMTTADSDVSSDTTTTALKWYIAGKDSVQSTDNVVLFAAQKLATSAFDASESQIYSASTLALKLAGLEYKTVVTNAVTDETVQLFTEAEDGLMLGTKLSVYPVYATAGENGSYTYVSSDASGAEVKAVKLYALNGVGYSEFITAGAEDELKITNSYWADRQFWLRAPAPSGDYDKGTLIALESYIVTYYAGSVYSVKPAFDMNLSSVLFASAATAATASPDFETDGSYNVYTLRVKDTGNKIGATAVYDAESVYVEKTTDGEVYLYVQDADNVYAKQITETTTVKITDMTGISSLTEETTHIWLETTSDNLTYAKEAAPKAKLLKITAPNDINVENGTEKTVKALGLPETVVIETEDTEVTSADVAWDLDNLAEGSYDPSVLTEQTFKVNGTVTLPESIVNTNTIALDVQVTVTAAAAGITAAPQADLISGTTFEENKTLTFSSATEDAVIYYTMTTDASTPAAPTTESSKYENAIALEGTEGETVTYKIKAIAVKSGMQDSTVTELTYTFSISSHTHTYTADWTSDDDGHWHEATCEHTAEIGSYALHSWNSGEITKEATTTEEGVITYTCTVCGKTKTDTIPTIEAVEKETSDEEDTDEEDTDEEDANEEESAGEEATDNDAGIPFIKGEDGTTGWDTIRGQLQEILAAFAELSGTPEETKTVTVAMNGTTAVPGDIFTLIKGKNVTVIFDLGDGITWKVNGQNVTADSIGEINFGVMTNASAIPAEIINNVTGERMTMQISLAYDGEFGFTAVLSVNVDPKNAGLYANLFYYHPQNGELEFMNYGRIAEDGSVELTFTHASDYLIVIDSNPLDGSVENDTDAALTSPKTDDANHLTIWCLLMLAAIGSMAAIGSCKKKEKDILR